MCRCDLASKHFNDFHCIIPSVCLYVCMYVYLCVCVVSRIGTNKQANRVIWEQMGFAAMLSTEYLPM